MSFFLPYQVRWVEDPAPVKIAVKARQIGLTWCTGIDKLWKAAEGLAHTTYMAYDEDIGREFIADIQDYARRAQIALSGDIQEDPFYAKEQDLKSFSIQCASGKRITAIASSPRKFRGRRGYVIIDEAAFHPNLEEVIQAALKVPTWGGAVEFISTHLGEENPFNDLVQRTRAGELPYSLHEIDLDLAIQEGLYKRICTVTGKEWSPQGEVEWRAAQIAQYPDPAAADEELFCIPRSGGASYFQREMVQACAVPGRPVVRLYMPEEFEQETPEDKAAHIRDWCWQTLAPLLASVDRDSPWYMGYDFARVRHLSVLCPVGFVDGTLEVPWMLELGRMPHEQQRQIAHFVIDGLPRFSGACFDAGGNGSWLAEVTAEKYPDILGVKITPNWYSDVIPMTQKTLQSRKITIPDDKDVIKDFTKFEIIKGRPTLPGFAAKGRGGGGMQRHGDAAIAIALALQAARDHADLAAYLDHVCSTR